MLPRESDSTSNYIGEELELFSLAVNWKAYWGTRLRQSLRGDLLEVGAGLGGNAATLPLENVAHYLALEPDPRLCAEFLRRQQAGLLPAKCEVLEGTLESLPAAQGFDVILYIDVLEHIQDDRAEFARALERLLPGGHLCVLCPAHNFLFSPFDKAIGHHRRYNLKMFRELSPQPPVRLEMLDSVGLAASLANKLWLRQSYPTARQIRFWDGTLVPLSRWLDPLTCRRVGKSILGIWRKS